MTEAVPHIPSLLYVSPRLYSVSDEGIVNCIQGATGEVLWRHRLPGKYSPSPVYADGKVYFLSESGKAAVIEEGPEFKQVAQNDGRDLLRQSGDLAGQPVPQDAEGPLLHRQVKLTERKS